MYRRLTLLCLLLPSFTSFLLPPIPRPVPLHATAPWSGATSAVLEKVTAQITEDENVPNELIKPLEHFIGEYMRACEDGSEGGDVAENIVKATQNIATCINLGATLGMGPSKYTFGVSHDAIRTPFDYYQFGIDFFQPAIDVAGSVVRGEGNLRRAMEQQERGENVVFLANHQSEADPQVMSTMMAKAGCSSAAEKLFYVAGHKVTTDPLAIPFSMGRNLICIHSKKHIEADEETKPGKQRQNLQSMGNMLSRMKEGGFALWVAPSGGRDRRDLSTKTIPVAPFDSKTIDMFRLMARKSKVPTHFYPLAMVSYELCPPPDEIVAGVGEIRNVRFTKVGIDCGEEIVNEGGLEARHAFCQRANEVVEELYGDLRKTIFE